MTRTEKLVYELSKKSFLSLWCYPNPRGKNNKELCDILVYCIPDIIIISVKEIIPTESGDYSVDLNRWIKSAFEKSYRQLYGAERYLKEAKYITLNDGTVGPSLIDQEKRRYHRLAIAIGGEDKMPLMWGDFGKGFVHIFDEISCNIVMKELDTITDFIHYLSKKEELYLNQSEKEIVLAGGEEDLLAFYFRNGLSFKCEGDMIVLDNSLWKGYVESDDYKRWVKKVKVSLMWDNLIELLSNDYLNDRMIAKTTYDDFEMIVRVMARESRLNRIDLGRSFVEFYKNPNIRSRPVASTSGVVYVFLTVDRNEDRENRRAELIGRCLIVRKYTPEAKLIIGIATEKNDGKNEFSFDVFYLHKPRLTKEEEIKVEHMVQEFGWFKNSFNRS